MAISTLIALALQAAQPAPGPPGVLDLLDGEWICRAELVAGNPVWRTETWRRDSEGRPTGIVGLRDSHDRGGQEAELIISGSGRDATLTYRPTGGAPVRYRLVRDERQETVFESTGNGSPRIISYRYTSFGALEVMYGLADGGSRRWSYRRPGMHMGILACDGRR